MVRNNTAFVAQVHFSVRVASRSGLETIASASSASFNSFSRDLTEMKVPNLIEKVAAPRVLTVDHPMTTPVDEAAFYTQKWWSSA